MTRYSFALNRAGRLLQQRRPTWAEYFRALLNMEVRPIILRMKKKTHAQIEKQRRRNRRRSRINGVRAIRGGP